SRPITYGHFPGVPAVVAHGERVGERAVARDAGVCDRDRSRTADGDLLRRGDAERRSLRERSSGVSREGVERSTAALRGAENAEAVTNGRRGHSVRLFVPDGPARVG